MLRSETLFGKREPTSSSPLSSTALAPNSTINTSVHGTGSSNAAVAAPAAHGTSLTKAPGSSLGSKTGNDSPLSTSVSTSLASSFPAMSSTNETGSKLIVGPNIKLKGVEITDCDTLVVEGKVEATIDSRVIQIAGSGSFKGAAEIDIAEIHGEYDGELTVRQKLVIYATGKVTGKVRYGKVVIEEGGQLSGDIQVGTPAAAPRSLTMAKTAT
jgi:cytoskeletal protein CcmA (bactofilin family)